MVISDRFLFFCIAVIATLVVIKTAEFRICIFNCIIVRAVVSSFGVEICSYGDSLKTKNLDTLTDFCLHSFVAFPVRKKLYDERFLFLLFRRSSKTTDFLH